MDGLRPHVLEVLAFDARPLLTRLEFAGKLRPGQRFQRISLNDVLVPVEKGLCACGCGLPITPPMLKWHNRAHSFFADAVAEIIRGNPRIIGRYLGYRHGRKCATCGQPDGMVKLEVDHIVPVANGGGGRWLDNYQLLCGRCHKHKTAEQLRYAAENRRKYPNTP